MSRGVIKVYGRVDVYVWSVVTVVSTLVRRERMSSCGREPIFAEKKCRDPLSYLLVLIVMSFLIHLKLT